jgi:hypothetical protein
MFPDGPKVLSNGCGLGRSRHGLPRMASTSMLAAILVSSDGFLLTEICRLGLATEPQITSGLLSINVAAISICSASRGCPLADHLVTDTVYGHSTHQTGNYCHNVVMVVRPRPPIHSSIHVCSRILIVLYRT